VTRRRNKPRPILQHTVPQLLLRGFTNPTTGQLYAYDKLTDKVFPTGTPAVAAEKAFYDLKVAGRVITIDPALTRLESSITPILTSIVLNRSIAALSGRDRKALSLFVAVQLVRGRGIRDRFKAFNDAMIKKCRERGIEPTKVKNFGVMSEDHARFASLTLVSEAGEFAPHIYNKTWLLFQASPPNAFWISDNPVTMNNDSLPRDRATLGLAVKGIQINLPISSELSLGFYCRSIGEEFRKRYLQFKGLSLLDPLRAARMCRDPLFNEAFALGLDESRPVTLGTSSVIHVNSLQVAFSTRFVYSPNNHFNLVRRMISDDPRYRGAPLSIIS